MNEYKIKIGGLDCPNCTAKLERGIKENKNFFDVSLSFVNKLLILKSELSIEEVKHELNKIINKVEPDAFIEEKEHHHKHHHHEHKDCCCNHVHMNTIMKKSVNVIITNIIINMKKDVVHMNIIIILIKKKIRSLKLF